MPVTTTLLFVFVGVLLGVIGAVLISRARKLRQERTEESQRAYAILQRAVTSLFQSEYLAVSERHAWRRQNAEAINTASRQYLADYLPEDQAAAFHTWCAALQDLDTAVPDHNQRFMQQRTREDRVAFDGVERFPLTTRQREAIVTNEDTTLIIAGAGTGKTSTIIGKVDYLVRRKLARPDQILVLAFARKASEELKERLARFGDARDVTISTFHALGLAIIGEVEEQRPAISPLAEDDKALRRFIRSLVDGMLANPEDNELLIQFFADYLDDDVKEDETTTGDEWIRLQKARGLRAINGTKLRSREEVQIANWLTLNGIAWEYERPYPHPTANRQKRAYQPDFYLPAYDLYLEHFGINANGRTAPHIDSARYARDIEWKRDIHRTHGTALVETFSYFKKQGGLINRLEELLQAHGVTPQPLTEEQIAAITDEANRPFSDFVNLLAQFLSVYKGNGASESSVRAKAETDRDHVFLAIFERIYQPYVAELQRTGQIDFNDMINRARAHVQSGRYRSPFTYIVVDEFQDISLNRLGLLQDLRAPHPHGRLFVVGDDWQSIFRFAGSDVGIITSLPEFVGATARVDLDTAFRYPQELLDVSSAFVTANPHQLRKQLTAHQGSQGELPIALIREQRPPKGQTTSAGLESAFNDIINQARGKPAHVFLLGRYNSSKPSIPQEIWARLLEADVSLEFLTAHRSKGKEADFVIVLGLEEGGFPSIVADDPVMGMVLTQDDGFPFAEERRLFYVAITRAKRRVYLIAPQDKASPFVENDLLGEALRGYVETIGEVSKRYHCPRCYGATIRRTEGNFGSFWGCSHYPVCDGKFDACPYCPDGGLEPVRANGHLSAYRCTVCQRTAPLCPACRVGFLRPRTGKYGDFFACSKWDGGEGCTYTSNALPVTVTA